MLSLSPILAFLIAFQSAPAPSALERFFAGRTEGNGSVRVILSGTSAVRTQGRGRILPDGSLTLDHVVRQDHRHRDSARDAPITRTRAHKPSESG